MERRGSGFKKIINAYQTQQNYKNDKNKALFYIREAIKNNWSRAVLLNFIDTDLYERQDKAITNFDKSLPSIDTDLAKEITKDPYNFDFLNIRIK